MAPGGENGGEPSLALALASSTTAVDEGIQYFYGQLCNFCNSKTGRRKAARLSLFMRGRPLLISTEN